MNKWKILTSVAESGWVYCHEWQLNVSQCCSGSWPPRWWRLCYCSQSFTCKWVTWFHKCVCTFLICINACLEDFTQTVPVATAEIKKWLVTVLPAEWRTLLLQKWPTFSVALLSQHCFFQRVKNCVSVVQQARDVRNNEVVAIKKMSYSGKQTNEVTDTF